MKVDLNGPMIGSRLAGRRIVCIKSEKEVDMKGSDRH
jgi:hypothetical protein